MILFSKKTFRQTLRPTQYHLIRYQVALKRLRSTIEATHTVLCRPWEHTTHPDERKKHISGPIPVAERSEAWVCTRLLAGTAGSNPARGMDVCLV